MTPDRTCQFCGGNLYGRADKRYCSSTCRRDASRVRQRVVRVGNYTFFGSERFSWESIEDVLIPRLERELGPNHRAIRDARAAAQALHDDATKRLGETMRRLKWPPA